MAPDIALSEALLVGVVGVLLAVFLYAVATSPRPDPKLLLLFSLLEALPRDEGEGAGQGEDPAESAGPASWRDARDYPRAA